MAVHTWTGAGVTDNWSEAANWVGNSAPAPFEPDCVVVFNTVDPLSVNDVSFIKLTQLRFDAGSEVTLSLSRDMEIVAFSAAAQAAEVVSSSGRNSITTGASVSELRLSPAADGTSSEFNFHVALGGTLDLGIRVSGFVSSIAKGGAGTLRFSPISSPFKSYDFHTIVRDGTVAWARGGNTASSLANFELTPDESSAGVAFRNEIANPFAFGSKPAFILTDNATLDLNGFDMSVGALQLNTTTETSPRVTTGAGQLGVGKLSTSFANGTTTAVPAPTILGKVGANEIQVPDGPWPVDLVIDASFAGAGTAKKTGTGTVSFEGTADNTYAGTVQVMAGTLLLNKTAGATAITGKLQVGGTSTPAGLEVGNVILLEDDQIADTADVSVQSGGRLDLNGKSEFVRSLSSFVTSGAAVVDLSNPASHLTVGAGATGTRLFEGSLIGSGTLSYLGTTSEMTFSGPIQSDLTIEVLSGRLTFDGGRWADGIAIRSLDIRAGAQFTLKLLDLIDSPALRLRTLSLAPSAMLTFFHGGGIILDYDPGQSPAAPIGASLASGYAAGTWKGTGINKLEVVVEGNPPRSIGYAENDPAAGGLGLTTFLGQNVDATSVLIRYTLPADADLDGTVGPADFNILASHFGQVGRTWQTGDFNYDGVVGAGDFNLLASNFGSALPTKPTVSSDAVASLRSEPAAPSTATKRGSTPVARQPLTTQPLRPGIVLRNVTTARRSGA